MADKYFKKPSGAVIKATAEHDLSSLKSRFSECNADGSALKPKPKAKKKKEIE